MTDHRPTDPKEPPDSDPTRNQRRKLQLEALTGFLGFFSVLAFVQAVMNAIAPSPKVWPALLALVLVVATVAAWRAGRKYR